jgi:hypothetical protein
VWKEGLRSLCIVGAAVDVNTDQTNLSFPVVRQASCGGAYPRDTGEAD